MRQVLTRLKGTLDRRGQSWERLVRLKGRLELLRAVKGGQGAKTGNDPEVRWVEEIPGEEVEEESEAEIEDVRYLTGDVEDEEGDSEIEVGGDAIEDLVENGVEDEEEEENDDSNNEDDGENEDEDECEDSEDEPKPKKVNGVPHFSDSEDSAVDLEDLIDDEASEASEDEDEEEEEDDEEEEEEEDVPPPPPKKKSKFRR